MPTLSQTVIVAKRPEFKHDFNTNCSINNMCSSFCSACVFFPFLCYLLALSLLLFFKTVQSSHSLPLSRHTNVLLVSL